MTVWCAARRLIAERFVWRRKAATAPLSLTWSWACPGSNWSDSSSPTAGSIDYTLNHCPVLTRHLDDGARPISNHHLERPIEPLAMGRKAWVLLCSELAGQRDEVVMSLVKSANLHRRDPRAHRRDVLRRPPMQLNSRIDQRMPQRWQAAMALCETAPN